MRIIMNKTMRLILAICLITAVGFCQLENKQTITKRGTTSAQFLKIGVDARGSSMGGAFTAMTGDISQSFWNPAGLAHLEGIQTMFVNSPWLAGTNFNFMALAFNVPSIGVFGASVTSLAVPEDIVRTIEHPEGTGERFDAGDLAVTFSYAKQLSDRFSIGGNIKYIQQKIWHASARAIAADLGAVFISPFKGIRIGASISNFGNDMMLDGRDLKISVDPDIQNEGNVEFINALYETDNFPLPLLFRVGLAGELLNKGKTRLSFSLDALHPNDNTESINTGLEFAFAETFFVRGGYSTLFRDATEEGLTLGAGMLIRLAGTNTKLKVDYSYSDFGRFDFIQRISLGFRF